LNCSPHFKKIHTSSAQHKTGLNVQMALWLTGKHVEKAFAKTVEYFYKPYA
jgi:hypothetical protein